MNEFEGLMTPAAAAPEPSATTAGADVHGRASPRYALYWTPAEDCAWGSCWSHWLGRCAARDEALTQPAIDGVAPDILAALTADPRRYGLHATLKPPFRLAAGCTLDELLRALRAYCDGRIAFLMPTLTLAQLDGFLALVPVTPHAPIERIEDDLVRRFDRFRAPLTHDELARRRAQRPLSPREESLLARWGYPWVLDRFRFHVSITGNIGRFDDGVMARVADAARNRVTELAGERLRFDAVAVFEEPAPGEDFRQIARIPFRS